MARVKGSKFTLTSGYPTADDLGDALEDMDYGRGSITDPVGYFSTFTIPGMPIAVVGRGTFRGRRGDTATISDAPISKGVLPL